MGRPVPSETGVAGGRRTLPGGDSAGDWFGPRGRASGRRAAPGAEPGAQRPAAR